MKVIIEIYQPKVVLETGVANGISTRIFCEAVPDGIIHSVDINENVITDELQKFKNLLIHIINRPSQLREIINSLDRLDLFFHDSDHDYNNQFYEYELAWQKLSSNGILISDDINWSYAWIDFCAKYNIKSTVLADSTKFIGLAFKNR